MKPYHIDTMKLRQMQADTKHALHRAQIEIDTYTHAQLGAYAQLERAIEQVLKAQEATPDEGPISYLRKAV